MHNSKLIAFIFVLFFYAFAKAQEDTPEDTITDAETITTTTAIDPYDPLRPAKAAFYAAVLPGLGQVYNKDYWKLPLVYGAIGATLYGVQLNSSQAERARTALKDRFAGRIDEFTEIDPLTGLATETISDERLIDRQNFFQRRRDLFILLTGAAYILQIIEANVDAHLSQYDVDDDLTFGPNFYWDELGGNINYGMKLTYRF